MYRAPMINGVDHINLAVSNLEATKDFFVLLGFEVPDLLFIFLVLSTLNFLFGSSSLKIFLVWIPSIVLATAIRVSKRGKPDNYLVHWLRYQLMPGVLSAFDPPAKWKSPPSLKRRF